MKLSKLLTTWRTSRQLTQGQAARVLKVSTRNLQNWEQGRNTPEGETAIKLLERMNTEKGKQ